MAQRARLKPGLWQLVLCGLACFTCLIIALNLDPVRQYVIALIFLASALVFGVTWIYALVIFFLWSWADVQTQFGKAKYAGEIALTDSQNEQMRLIERLPDDRLALVGKLRAAILMTPGTNAPEFTLTIGDKSLPYDLVDGFMARCSRVWLCPIGTFPDDTPARECAETMTAFFINEGYASPARGSRPARWMDYEGACERIAWTQKKKAGASE